MVTMVMVRLRTFGPVTWPGSSRNVSSSRYPPQPPVDGEEYEELHGSNGELVE